MKAMGIDFGLARIGIALSDETKFLASPYITYKRKNEKEDIDFFVNLIIGQNIDEIVCGLPLNMQGEEQRIAQLTREFIRKISDALAQQPNQKKAKIDFVDERMSSIIADDILKNTIKDWKKRKEKLDSVSASIILQDYLDSRR